MNKDELLALAERVEAVTVVDMSLSAQVLDACGLSWANGDPLASLDAAMSLVPEDVMWRLGHDGEGSDPSQFLAVIVGMTERWWSIAATPALALTAAALRAIASGAA